MTRKRRKVATVFGERVRARRHELGLSQEEVAERAGMHFTYVGSVERGERNISLVNIVRLAAALGVDPGELLRGLR
ncbi:MAG: helix-turn-helix domain-containing protein [Actinomycetota bacterium]